MVDDKWLGTQLAGYRIEALIGRGGAGVVYRATQLRLQRPAAVKLLAPGLASDAEYRRRFEREAHLAASLEHPCIVPIYDAGFAEGVLYLAMRYIDGPNLAAVIGNNGPMSLHQVCALLTDVAGALDSAHHAGLVHRDVKPANVLIAAPNQPPQHQRAYLCDFGIARHTASSSTLTTTGQFLGTLQYSAPEQIQGHPVDGRADQYALACVVFHCLTGQVPYPADEPAAAMFAHISASPPRASAHVQSLPPATDEIIARALAKNPAHRFPDCTTFLHALATAANTTSLAAPRPTPHTPPAPGTPHTVIWPSTPNQPAPLPPNPTANHTPERRRKLSQLGVAVAGWTERKRRPLSIVAGLLLMLVAGIFLFEDTGALPVALLGIAGAGLLLPMTNRLLGSGWLLGVTPITTLYLPWLVEGIELRWFVAILAFGLAFWLAMLAVAGNPDNWFTSRLSREARTIMLAIAGVIVPLLALLGAWSYDLALAWPYSRLLLLPVVSVAAFIGTRGWLRCAALTGSTVSAAAFALNIFVSEGRIAGTELLTVGSIAVVLAALTAFAYRAARERRGKFHLPDVALGLAGLAVIGVAVSQWITSPVVARIYFSDNNSSASARGFAIAADGRHVY
jgi:serine/threonine protein kinase